MTLCMGKVFVRVHFRQGISEGLQDPLVEVSNNIIEEQGSKSVFNMFTVVTGNLLGVRNISYT